MKKIFLILCCTIFLFSCKSTEVLPGEEEGSFEDINIEESSPVLPEEDLPSSPEELVLPEELPPVAEESEEKVEPALPEVQAPDEKITEIEVQSTEDERPLLESGLIVAKHIVVDADSSSSIVVDWLTEKKVSVEKPAFSESEVVYKTDEKGNEFKMKILYHPENKKKQGIVIFIPGGDFLDCDINSFEDEREYLCEKGFVVTSMEYHTATNGIYTDALKDISDAIMFMRMHFRDYNADPTKLALAGTSAGGYLASLFACMDSSAITCVVDLYGYTDLLKVADDFEEETKEKHRQYNAAEAQFVNGKESRLGIFENFQEATRANPLTYVDGKEVPFLFMHGNADKVVSPSQTVILHNLLLSKGVRSVRCSLIGSGHGGPGFFGESALSMIVDFLSDNFNPQKSLLQK